jgi:hypothetical protein
MTESPSKMVVPSVVQMGWVESPPLFCAVTESARHITQHLIDNRVCLPAHPLEDKISIKKVPMRTRMATPTKLLQVCVVDFCNAATQLLDGGHIPTIKRASIHGVHAVFPEPAVTGHQNRKEPLSIKKLEQGDRNFTSTKDLIGFTFNGIKRTIQLPPLKATAYIRETHCILQQKLFPLKALQTLVGKLRHASIILPPARGFFTPINAAMKVETKVIGLGKASEIRAALEDLCSLLRLLGLRPTHVRELVVDMPRYAGYQDAAAEGAGGVWFSLVHNMQPVVWRLLFPCDIPEEVVLFNNPSGRLTNLDLELAAEVMGVGVLLAEAPVITHEPLGALCDNTPTVSWIEKMASKSITPMAGRLLRGLAFMLYCHRAGRLTTIHVLGPQNIMADIASRPSKTQTFFHATTPVLSDHDFLSLFNVSFPLPDQQAWGLAQVPPWLKSNVFETLRGKQLDLQLWMGPNGNGIGGRGRCIAASTRSTAKARLFPHMMSKTCSSHLLLPCGKASMASDVRSRFNQSQLLSGLLPKDTFWTDIAIRATHHQPSTI